MIYKMTSSKAVIAKVIADLGLNETEIPIQTSNNGQAKV